METHNLSKQVEEYKEVISRITELLIWIEVEKGQNVEELKQSKALVNVMLLIFLSLHNTSIQQLLEIEKTLFKKYEKLMVNSN
jgi:predicted metal-binding protein